MSVSNAWSFPCYGNEEQFEPTPDELDTMYQKLAAGETITLDWKCPGRRPPTPVKVVTETKDDTKAKKSSKELEFDFMDEVAAPAMRVRGPPSKTTAKKKTASFANVLNTIKKNKRTVQS